MNNNLRRAEMKAAIARCLLGAMLSIAAWLPATAAALPYTGLFVFGDSLADSGNNAIVLDKSGLPPGTLRTPTPIPRPGFVPNSPYQSDRYSNGPVWPEYFAASLGLNAMPSMIAGGTNWAFGGARSGPIGSPFPFSLPDQVSMFLSGSGGAAPPGALYVVEGGGNDARDIFAKAAGGTDPTPLISAYALNIRSVITTLESAGAHDILLWNIPDIGKTPAVQALGPLAAGLASSVTMTMNDMVDIMLGFHTGLRRFDAFSLVDQIFNDPAAFGLTDATSACAASPACVADPSHTFFWDGIHPTTAGHAIFAQAALAAIPEPSTGLLLGAGLLLIVTCRKIVTS